MACKQMMTLEQICMFLFILRFITLVNCTRNLQFDGCIAECVNYLLIEESQYNIPLETLQLHHYKHKIENFIVLIDKYTQLVKTRLKHITNLGKMPALPFSSDITIL